MTEESAKFILGVMAIVLLFLLVSKLAGIMRQNSQYEQAKYALGEIQSTLDSLKEGENGSVFIESPKNWYLIPFVKEQGFLNMPISCGSENCLCLCPEPQKNELTTGTISPESSNYYWIKEGKTLCEKKGICISRQNKINIEGMSSNVLTHVGGKALAKTYQSVETKFMQFNPVPIKLEIEFKNNSFLIK